MENEEKRIAETAKRMEEMGLAVPLEVSEALASFDCPNYKVGIVGRFQVGKSHLVNESFLNQTLLLKEGEGLCTTAVTTEIAFGTVPKLTITYKDGRPAKIIENPQAEDIRAATSSNDADTRTKIGAETENVRLEWPCEALKNFTLYDTAGIDDPNPELLRLTTYKTIPQLDVAVLVVGAKTLSAVEMNFLRKNIFAYGIGRIMVLVSYNPVRDMLSERGRADLLNEIRSQLADIGRENVPVHMVCYGEEQCADILHDAVAIRDTVQTFAVSATRANRVAKVKAQLRKILSERLRDLEFKLSLADKDESELLEIRKKYADLENEMKAARDEMLDDFDGTLHAIKQEQTLRFRAACLDAANRYMNGFNECIDLGEAQKYFAKVQELITPEVESLAVERFEDIRNAIASKLKEYSSRIQEVCKKKQPNASFAPEISLDGGFFDKLNSSAITLADYLLSMFLLPGGIFIAWCLRFLAGQIPGVKRFVPTALVKEHMVETVRSSLNSELECTVDAFRDNVGDALQALRTEIFKTVNEDIESLAKMAASAAETHQTAASVEDAQDIGMQIADCNSLLATL